MKFHDQIYAQSYEEKLSSEGYPGLLLQKIKPLIIGKTLLDIGAGTGFFTIPLLNDGFKVTALDPSKEMLNLLSKKLKNIHQYSLINDYWENVQVPFYDTIICVHALYPMVNVKASIHKMLNQSRNVLVIIRSDNGNITLSEKLRGEFMKQKKKSFLNDNLQNILYENNTIYNIERVVEERIIYIDDIVEESKYYSLHLNIDDIDKIKQTLLKFIEYDKISKKYIYTATYKDNIYQINNK